MCGSPPVRDVGRPCITLVLCAARAHAKRRYFSGVVFPRDAEGDGPADSVAWRPWYSEFVVKGMRDRLQVHAADEGRAALARRACACLCVCTAGLRRRTPIGACTPRAETG